MKFILMLAALLAISTHAYAAPADLVQQCDRTVWASEAISKVCAARAAKAAAISAARFEYAGGVSFGSDPIGARIAAAKPVKAAKPKPATSLTAAKPVKAAKLTRFAAAFTPEFIQTLQQKK